MKRLLILTAVMISLTGCKKKLTQFYVDFHSEVVVQSTFGQFVPFSLTTPEITTNSQAEFESNNTNKDHIESIYLKDLILTIKSPQNETFSFLNSVQIFISSPSVAEQKVAYKTDIPANAGTNLVCDLISTDLQSFIKDDKFTIRVETVTDETVPQDVTIDVYSNFFVDAKLIK